MKITVLGSCSGTEPYPRRHQTSVAIETGGQVYFIDAGENAGYASYLGGVPQQDTGGLPHLLWNFRKLCTIDKDIAAHMEGKVIQVHIPDLSVFEGVMAMLRASEGNYETVFHLDPHLVRDGVLYDRDGFKLTAFHNYHLGTPKPGLPFLSYTFLVEAEGKKVLFSGDFRDFSEIAPQMEGCDMVFLETGHHTAAGLCQELKDSGIQVGKVVFYHHGMEILLDCDGELAAAKAVLGGRVTFADDGSAYQL